MGNPVKPSEETIMNSLENSSMAIEAGNNSINQSDPVNSKSNIDKPIIDTGTMTTMSTKMNKVVMRVINGVVVSVTILVTLFMRSSGSSVMSGNHVRRGFYCDDLSIRYPVQPETVSTKVLIGASFIGGLTLFCIIEYCVIKCNTYLPMHSVQFCRGIILKIPAWIGPATKTMCMCFVASMANSILTDICKNVIGWPRPNFMAVCRPNVTCDASNRHEFIAQFHCLDATEEKLEDQKKELQYDAVDFENDQ